MANWELYEAAKDAFSDMTSDIEERATERMNFRIRPHVKATIRRAAMLSGVDDSVFTMRAAYASALETIAAHERTILEPVDHSAFFDALDNPPDPAPELQEAFARHRKRVRSR